MDCQFHHLGQIIFSKMNRLIFLTLIFCGIVFSQKYNPEFSTAGFYETDKSVRQAIDFNIGWRFIKKDVIGAEKIDYDDSKWNIVNLPDGLEILPLNASGSINYQGPAWYRKHFTLNNDLNKKKIMLHFEGIMGKSKIWINGVLLEENYSGYYPVHIDITNYLNFGKPNVVAVRADNSNDKSFPPGKPQELLDFTYFGGIYRDSWLIVHNNIYVTHPLAEDKIGGGGLLVHYDNLNEKTIDVSVSINIKNEEKKKSALVELRLLDNKGLDVFTNKQNIVLESNKSTNYISNFKIFNPKLWTPDNPQLHDLHVTIKSTNGEL